MVHPKRPDGRFEWNDKSLTYDWLPNPIRRKARTRYPGRNRVMSRQDAVEARERQLQADWEGRGERYPCTQPYMVEAIGLPSAATAMHRYWKGSNQGKVPVELPARCRKCANCLKHKRRLWTARAVDELKASNRTWFGTLTFDPVNRFRIDLKASIAASRAGHGRWHGLLDETRFQWLTKAAGLEVTDWLKRVRSQSGVPLRYLLVCEPHKDWFPHFHLLLHESDQPVRKALLESQWRSGFSHWRLVEREDPKSVYYACKYLTKSHQTRVRASRRYGREQLLLAATERLSNVLEGATRLLPEKQPACPVEEKKTRVGAPMGKKTK